LSQKANFPLVQAQQLIVWSHCTNALIHTH